MTESIDTAISRTQQRLHRAYWVRIAQYYALTYALSAPALAALALWLGPKAPLGAAMLMAPIPWYLTRRAGLRPPSTMDAASHLDATLTLQERAVSYVTAQEGSPDIASFIASQCEVKVATFSDSSVPIISPHPRLYVLAVASMILAVGMWYYLAPPPKFAAEQALVLELTQNPHLPEPVKNSLAALAEKMAEPDASVEDVKQQLERAAEDIVSAEQDLKQGVSTDSLPFDESSAPSPTPSFRPSPTPSLNHSPSPSPSHSPSTPPNGEDSKKSESSDDAAANKSKGGGNGDSEADDTSPNQQAKADKKQGKGTGEGEGSDGNSPSKGQGKSQGGNSPQKGEQGKGNGTGGAQSEQGEQQNSPSQGQQGEQQAKDGAKSSAESAAQALQQAKDAVQKMQKAMSAASPQSATESPGGDKGDSQKDGKKGVQKGGKSGDDSSKNPDPQSEKSGESGAPSHKGETPGKEQGKNGKAGEKESNTSPGKKPEKGEGSEKSDKSSSRTPEGSESAASALPDKSDAVRPLPEGDDPSRALAGSKLGYQNAEIKGADEKVDSRYAGAEGAKVKNARPATPKTSLSEVTRARPEAGAHDASQPIPLEYKDLIE